MCPFLASTASEWISRREKRGNSYKPKAQEALNISLCGYVETLKKKNYLFRLCQLLVVACGI